MGNSNSKQQKQQAALAAQRRAQYQAAPQARPHNTTARGNAGGQVDHASQLLAARNCEICDEPSPKAIECSGGHRVCTECFSAYVEVTWVANTQGKIADMSAAALPEVRCVVPGCASRPFSMTEVIRNASDSAAKAYLDIIQRTKDGQTYAHAQQLLAQGSNNGNAELKQGALLQAQLQAQIGGNSLQCPKCNFGPVEMTGCSDLSSHDGNRGVSNKCPNCGFFSPLKSAWKTWDGTLPQGALAVVPGKKPPSPPQRTRALTVGQTGAQQPSPVQRPRSSTTTQPRVHFADAAPQATFRPTLANLGPGAYDPTAEAMTQRLIRFYNVYDRDRLVKVPEIIQKYHAIGYDELFTRLVAKYGPEPGAPRHQPAQPQQQQRAMSQPPPQYGSQSLTPSHSNGSFTYGSVGPGSGDWGTNPSSPNGSVAAFKAGAPPAAAPPQYTSHPNSNGAPLKYIKGKDGIRRINPDYMSFHQRRNPQAAQSNPGTVAGTAVTSTSVLHPNTALAVCSNMDEYSAYFQDQPLAPATDNAIARMQEEPSVPIRVGLEPDTMTDELGRILSKYEAPIGMMPKLMVLGDFDLLEFIVDDSGSMNLDSDVRGRFGGAFLTRWEEVKARIETMCELLSCVPTPQINIVFLNRTDRITLRANGYSDSPAAFMAEAKSELDRVWRRDAQGRTPAYEAIQRSFLGRERQSVVRYFFGDGEPNGGRSEEQRIGAFLKNRSLPARNPFTFMSCTDNDDQTEWMKDVEEIAPYCAEYDDFLAEAREVARDHGAALPYSLGMHLVGQLVGALNPNDLDALDESVPLTKMTLDNLLGFQHSDNEYRHYFTNFTNAQRGRTIRTPADRLRKDTKWDKLYKEFTRAAAANEIKQVREYHVKLRQLAL